MKKLLCLLLCLMLPVAAMAAPTAIESLQKEKEEIEIELERSAQSVKELEEMNLINKYINS